MKENTLHAEIRKYLKQVGATSQQEIEQAILKAVDNGKLRGSESVTLKMTLEVPALGITRCVAGKITLE